jgi:hypothetical protein
MHKVCQFFKEKLRISSWQALVHLVIVQIILNLIWGWVSNMFEVVLIREIGFLVIFVAGIFAVAWYLPKLAPALYSFGTIRTAKPATTRRLEHDGVLWEDGGYNSWGNIYVIGPLCPKDYTPLAIKQRDRIETYINDGTLISDSEYHSKLVCPECEVEYTLGKKYKSIKDSRHEVGNRFEGKRRRDQ